MALKRQNNLMAAFSMASMTDVIFLLLIFFMVTSTFVFPTALEVNLPQSSQQTNLKPAIKIFIDKEGNAMVAKGDSEPASLSIDQLATWLQLAIADQPERPTVALFADEEVSYGEIVKILNIGANNDIKIVLATRPAKGIGVAPTPVEETVDTPTPSTTE